MSDFGILLRRARIAAGKTQAQTCRDANTYPAMLSQLESGRLPPPRSSEFVARLAEAVGGDVDEFCLAAGVWPPDMTARRSEVVAMWREQVDDQ